MLNNTITRHMMPSFTDLEAATFLEKRGYTVLELDNLKYQLITSFDDETRLEDRNDGKLIIAYKQEDKSTIDGLIGFNYSIEALSKYQLNYMFLKEVKLAILDL